MGRLSLLNTQNNRCINDLTIIPSSIFTELVKDDGCTIREIKLKVQYCNCKILKYSIASTVMAKRHVHKVHFTLIINVFGLFVNKCHKIFSTLKYTNIRKLDNIFSMEGIITNCHLVAVSRVAVLKCIPC